MGNKPRIDPHKGSDPVRGGRGASRPPLLQARDAMMSQHGPSGINLEFTSAKQFSCERENSISIIILHATELLALCEVQAPWSVELLILCG
ncbi:hypothetical protein RRG08_032692 [Elysia crispata]|uniref:Uncharacterized protein n=1 Tax=Elysia crispata TaxID=231223 RepID=A0AAE0YUP5_9GAST|nr:hypothetical protein RRG08_032692 [Elysia crispata]